MRPPTPRRTRPAVLASRPCQFTPVELTFPRGVVCIVYEHMPPARKGRRTLEKVHLEHVKQHGEAAHVCGPARVLGGAGLRGRLNKPAALVQRASKPLWASSGACQQLALNTTRLVLG